MTSWRVSQALRDTETLLSIQQVNESKAQETGFRQGCDLFYYIHGEGEVHSGGWVREVASLYRRSGGHEGSCGHLIGAICSQIFWIAEGSVPSFWARE